MKNQIQHTTNLKLEILSDRNERLLLFIFSLPRFSIFSSYFFFFSFLTPQDMNWYKRRKKGKNPSIQSMDTSHRSTKNAFHIKLFLLQGRKNPLCVAVNTTQLRWYFWGYNTRTTRHNDNSMRQAILNKNWTFLLDLILGMKKFFYFQVCDKQRITNIFRRQS